MNVFIALDCQLDLIRKVIYWIILIFKHHVVL